MIYRSAILKNSSRATRCAANGCKKSGDRRTTLQSAVAASNLRQQVCRNKLHAVPSRVRNKGVSKLAPKSTMPYLQDKRRLACLLVMTFAVSAATPPGRG